MQKHCYEVLIPLTLIIVFKFWFDFRYSKEWESTVIRLGRWIDFENDYKTLDVSFMESVWWVFKQLYEKDLVYQGFKASMKS